MADSELDVVSVEWAAVPATRPHPAGPNARVGAAGQIVDVRIARLTLRNGAWGWGHSRGSQDDAVALIGRALPELLDDHGTLDASARGFEYPLWDLKARCAGVPVFRLAAKAFGLDGPEQMNVPCYDTSIYFDDLQSPDEKDGLEHIRAEVAAGLAAGHRNCKVKIGRGARFMALDEGMRRDVAVVRTVREALGPDGFLMVDANNGYNLSLAKQFLDATADCDIYWLEEAFGDDVVLYGDLKRWMRGKGIETLIADGEVNAPARILDWVRGGHIDVLQFDYAGYGLSAWFRTAARLHEWGRLAAPHHYGTFFGNFAAAHFGVLPAFRFVEWDAAQTPVVDHSLYEVCDGAVSVPNVPGFGLQLDDERFRAAVEESGFTRGAM